MMKFLRGLLPASVLLASLTIPLALAPAVLATAGESANGGGIGSEFTTYPNGDTQRTTWVFEFDAVGTGPGSAATGTMSLTQTIRVDYANGAIGSSVYVVSGAVECLSVDGDTALVSGRLVIAGAPPDAIVRVTFAAQDNEAPGAGKDRFGAFIDGASAPCGSATLADPITVGEITVVDVPDSDDDGVPDVSDNCPTVANPDQADIDGDKQGDACDADDDNDAVADAIDNCPSVSNTDQTNSDADADGDACDTDDDNDKVADTADNCPTVFNPEQTDTDNDGIGDACDPLIDADGDLVADATDNCPAIANADQADADGDGTGDACDAYPNNPNKDERKEKKDKDKAGVLVTPL